MTREFIDKNEINSSLINLQGTLNKVESVQKKRNFFLWVKNLYRKIVGKKKNEPKRISKEDFSF